MIKPEINIVDFANNNSRLYESAKPYPHIVIDNFFDEDVLRKISDEFIINNKSKVTFDNPNEKKTTLNDWNEFGIFTSKFIKFLNGKVFTNFLEQLTGIRDIIVDNTLEGGGLHQIGKGGYLKIHADFNKHSKTNYDRRLNVLVYLNENWRDKWGGDFEMWSKDLKKCKKKISPIFNRMVIFSTTDFSFHGHPSPLKTPKEILRRSVAMYYYTEGRPLDEVQKGLKYHSSLFKSRQDNSEDREMKTYNKIKKINYKEIIKYLLPSDVFDKIKDIKRKK